MRLLYIEDNLQFVEVALRQFLPAHQVTLATSLGEARQLFAREAFDAVLLDYDLPDGKGIDLMPELI